MYTGRESSTRDGNVLFLGNRVTRTVSAWPSMNTMFMRFWWRRNSKLLGSPEPLVPVAAWAMVV